MVWFGATKGEVARFKREALGGIKKKGKDYNFGISKKELLRIRKQVRS